MLTTYISRFIEQSEILDEVKSRFEFTIRQLTDRDRMLRVYDPAAAGKIGFQIPRCLRRGDSLINELF